MCIWGSGSCPDPVPVGPSTAEVDGIGAETTYTSDADGVTSVAAAGPTGPASAELTFDEAGAITKLTLNGPATSRTWDSQRGSTFTDAGTVVAASSGNGQDLAVAANPYLHGFEYQTFGAWETGRGTGVGTAGAFSLGSETEGSDIPTSGTAIFNGVAGGLYVDQAGEDYVVGANAALVADFANRTADFTSTGSEKVSLVDGSVSDAAGLDLDASLTYGSGSNAMTGSVSSANGMTGTIDGRFYGPDAAEAGGIFHLKGPGVETYGGGFGTRQR
jgi:hypothetical protein